MRRYLAVAMLCLSLTGCTWLASTFGDNPSQSTKTTIVEVFADSCHGYATALRTAAAALNQGLLSAPQIAAVDKAKGLGDSICNGPQPTNFASAAVTVLTATATIITNSGGK